MSEVIGPPDVPASGSVTDQVAPAGNGERARHTTAPFVPDGGGLPTHDAGRFDDTPTPESGAVMMSVNWSTPLAVVPLFFTPIVTAA